MSRKTILILSMLLLIISYFSPVDGQGITSSDLDVLILDAPDNIVAGKSYTIEIRLANLDSYDSIEITEISAQMMMFDTGNYLYFHFFEAGKLNGNDIEAIIGSNILTPGEVIILNMTIDTDYWEKTGDYTLSINVEGLIPGVGGTVFNQDTTSVSLSMSYVKIATIITGIVVAILIFILLMIKFRIYKLPGKKKEKKGDGKLYCQECFEEMGQTIPIFCQLWETRSQRCNAGPFCSEDCLQKHIRKGNHR